VRENFQLSSTIECNCNSVTVCEQTQQTVAGLDSDVKVNDVFCHLGCNVQSIVVGYYYTDNYYTISYYTNISTQLLHV